MVRFSEVGWLVGWLVGVLVGWLAGWLVGWLVRCLSGDTYMAVWVGGLEVWETRVQCKIMCFVFVLFLFN